MSNLKAQKTQKRKIAAKAQNKRSIQAMAKRLFLGYISLAKAGKIVLFNRFKTLLNSMGKPYFLRLKTLSF